MTPAVRFDQCGDVDALRIEDVERPSPAAGQVLVEVVAAGINPGEARGKIVLPTELPANAGRVS